MSSTQRRFRFIRGLIALTLLPVATIVATATPAAAMASVLVDKQVDATVVEDGEIFSYIIRFRCASITDDCSGVTITDTLPANLSLVSRTGSGGLVDNVSVVGSDITWTMVDPLPAGSTGLVKLQVRSNFGCLTSNQTIAANTASITSTDAGSANSTTPTVQVNANATDCTVPTQSGGLSKSDRVSTPGARSDFSFQLPSGADYVNGQFFVDDFPSDMFYLLPFRMPFAVQSANYLIEYSCDGGSSWGTADNAGDTSDLALANCEQVSAPDGAPVNVVMPIAAFAGTPIQVRVTNTAPTGSAVTDRRFFIPNYFDSRYVGSSALTNVATGTAGTDTGAIAIGPPELTTTGAKSLTGSPEQDFCRGTHWYPPTNCTSGSIDLPQGPADVLYTLRFTASSPYPYFMENFVVVDLLPEELEFDPTHHGFQMFNYQEGGYLPGHSVPEQVACNNPVFTVTEDWNSTGRTQLKWEFPGCVFETTGNLQQVRFAFSAGIKPGTPAGTVIRNDAHILAGPNELSASSCNTNGTREQFDSQYSYLTDTDDLDGDGDFDEAICGGLEDYTVPVLATLDTEKWVHGDADPVDHVSRYPNVGLTTSPDGTGYYDLFIENEGNTTIDRIELVDILPHTGGDSMVLNPSTGRGFGGVGSEWGVELDPAGAISVEFLPAAATSGTDSAADQDWSQAAVQTLTDGSDYVLSFSTSTNPCRFADTGGLTDQLHIDTGANVAAGAPAGCDDDPWGGAAAGARAFAIDLTRDLAAANASGQGDMIRIRVPIRANAGELPAAGTRNGLIAWNSFAYTSIGLDDPGTAEDEAIEMFSSEPIQVGLKMDEGGASLGDYVWIDADHDGTQAAGEAGVDGVTVSLYDTSGNLVDQVITGDDPSTGAVEAGWYRFNGLDPTTTYEVRLDNSADFQPSGPLGGYSLTLVDAAAGDLTDSDATDVAGVPTIAAATTAAAGSHTPTYDFGFWQPAGLGDFVWFDASQDGLQDLAELPVRNMTVNLYSADQPGGDGVFGTADDPVVDTTTTDTSGWYWFGDLAAGDYYVEFDLDGWADTTGLPDANPNNYGFTGANQSGNPINDSDAGSDGRTAITTLEPNELDPTWDAGIKINPTDPAEIGDVVWLDIDRDGIQDGGAEVPIAGVPVTLLRNGIPVSNTTTNGLGEYLFSDLEPGSGYAVLFTPPTGYVISDPDQGSDDAVDSDVDQATYETTPTTLDPNESDMTWDLGLFAPVSVGNLVWVDTNNDGTVDGSEAGLAGVAVRLFEADGTTPVNVVVAGGGAIGTADAAGVTNEITTDADGYYLFTELAPGDYVVEITAPAGYSTSTGTNGSASGPFEAAPDPDTTDANRDDNGTRSSGQIIAAAPVTLSPVTEPTTETEAGDTLTDPVPDASGNKTVDFGLFQPARLGNYVWNDLNRDGIQNEVASLGTNGITVELYDGATLVATTTTANDGAGNPGFYLFDDLVPGSYTVEFSNFPASATITSANGGSDDAADSDADPVTGRTGVTALAAGEEDLTIDAGWYAPTASLGNRVFWDVADDGLRNGADTGIDGVTVRLFDDAGIEVFVGPDGVLGSADDAAGGVTTSNGGYYLFTNLLPDTYIVEVVTPTGYVSSTPDAGDPDSDADDDDDNGSVVAATTVRSAPVDLAATGEPLTEADPTVGWPDSTPDAGSNLTVDFGFFRPIDLEISKSHAEPGPFVQGDTVTYTLTITNNGPGTALAGFTVTDTVPAGLDPIGITSSTGFSPCAFSGQVLTCTGDATLAPTTPLTITYTAEVVALPDAAPADLQNVTEVQPASGDVTETIPWKAIGDTSNPPTNNRDTDVIPLQAGTAIGDRVWYDTDHDGIQDGGENGVVGVTVRLLDENDAEVPTGPDGVLGTADDALGGMVTDASGLYRFSNLVPGDYRVEFSNLPADHVITDLDAGADDVIDSDTDGTLSLRTPMTTLDNGETDLTWDLGIHLEPASLGDTVWYDPDRDGIQDPDEDGIENVTVTLYAADGVTVIATTTTGPDGFYEFTDLEPGDYRVGFTPPPGHQISPDGAGADPALDSDADPTTGLSAVVTLDPGEHDPTIDAGLNVIPASIGDTVWFDDDRDGEQDPAELGVVGVTVRLLDAGGTEVASTVTDATGFYEFTGLFPGDYSLVFDRSTLPAGYGFTRPDVALLDSDDSDADRVTGATILTTLDPGEHDPTWDAGIFGVATIGDTVWFDEDHDGIQDPTEPGVTGVTVTLFDSLGNPLATATTDTDGFYEFIDLDPGIYSVGFSDLPTGFVFTAIDAGGDDTADSDADPTTGRTVSTVLDLGEDDPTWDAGIHRIPASIGDRVWFDEDRDGIQDPGEPGVGEVTVELRDEAGVLVTTTTTDADGRYTFADLPPGPYAVTFADFPADHELVVVVRAGTDPSVDSDADPTTFTTPVTVLDPGEDDPTWDAGLWLIPASVGDVVWLDTDGDGVQDPDERGVAGIVVILHDEDDNEVARVTTDEDGRYRFDDLPPGGYWLEFQNIPTDFGIVRLDAGGDNEIDSDADPTTARTTTFDLEPGEHDPTWDVGVSVEPEPTGAGSGSSGDQPDTIAFTGSETVRTALIGAWLAAAGLALLVWRRRRSGFAAD